jgi:predicted HTH domain antitoxin
MSLVISDADVRATGLSEAELRVELAVALFQSERLTLARASRLSGMSRLEFQRLLAGRRIAVHYTQAELDEDVQTLADLGLK